MIEKILSFIMPKKLKEIQVLKLDNDNLRAEIDYHQSIHEVIIKARLSPIKDENEKLKADRNYYKKAYHEIHSDFHKYADENKKLNCEIKKFEARIASLNYQLIKEHEEKYDYQNLNNNYVALKQNYDAEVKNFKYLMSERKTRNIKSKATAKVKSNAKKK